MSSVTRVSIVTGAASGIGARVARRLAGPGAGIVIHARENQTGCEQTAVAVQAAGGQAVVALGDLADPATSQALADAAEDSFGRLDCVIANAGYADKTPLADLHRGRLADILAVMTIGFLDLIQAARPALVESKAARVVALSAFGAHVFRTDLPAFPASAAAKAGLESLVRSAALDLAADGILVNAVVPGFVRKDAQAHSALTPEQWAVIAAKIPLGRIAEPEEVAEMVAFLASPAVTYVTGQCIHVNGGLI